MKKYFIFFIVVFGLVLFSACLNDNKSQNETIYTPITPTEQSSNNIPQKVNTLKIEILHFHPKTQCVSCKTIGAYAEETVNTFFSKELNNGRITFRHVNYELPENQELVLLYKPPGSALCIGVYDDQGHLYTEENYTVWYKIENKEGFMSYLKQLIDKRLNGDLTGI